jgi:hypothetical protein
VTILGDFCPISAIMLGINLILFDLYLYLGGDGGLLLTIVSHPLIKHTKCTSQANYCLFSQFDMSKEEERTLIGI